MNNLDSIDLELKEKIESYEFTPERLAWSLLIDDDYEKITNGKLLVFDNIDNINDLTLEEQTENKFQILLTVYFELIFGWYKLLHLMQNEMDNTFNDFKPDLSNITIDDLTREFKDKIKVLGFILYVKELNDDEHYNYEKDLCYCRILLKDLPSDSNYFYIKRHQLDPEKRYTFLRNGTFQLKTSIKKYFAVVKLPMKSFKIYFDLL
jgi:hypothetical protein